MKKQAGQAAEPAPSPDEQVPAEPTEALASVVARLRDELSGMRRAMRNRAVIEQAKGVLVERLGVTPDDAFDQLVRLSQRTNIKLAEVAAALVGATAPAPDPEHGAFLDDELGQYLARARSGARRHPAPPAREPAAEALQAQHQLLAARITTAREYPQIAETIAEASTGWPHPDAVLVLLRDPADALSPVGGYGTVDAAPLARAAGDAFARHDTVWLADTGDTALRSVLAVPLPAYRGPESRPEAEQVGVLAIGWAKPATLTDDAHRYLVALAEPIGRRVGRLSAADLAGAADDPVRTVLDSVPDPAALLTAVRDDEGRVVDFRYEYTNTAAAGELTGLAGPDATERTLLAVLPDTGSRLLLGEFAKVLADGTPCHLGDVTVDAAADGTEHSLVAQVNAARVGESVLVVWRTRTDADLLYDQLLQAERIGRIGSFWWNLRTGEARWSPELYRLFGRTEAEGALPLSDGEAYVHDDDWYAVQEAIRGALLAGRAFTVEHRLADAPGRRLRVSGEPEFDADGAVWAIRGTVQDVTSERAVESQLRRAQEALAAQRQRLAAESRAAETMRDALLPTDPELTTTPGVAVAGLCRSPESTGRVAGDWYDVFATGTGTYLVVGDVTGSGLAATVAAARLRNAVRAYAVLGMAPGELLTALNRMVGELAGGQLATLVVARYSPDGHVLQWAAAGQAAPVRYAPDGRPAVLTGPLGLPVGAAPDIAYEETTVDLGAGDRVLLYTDGLVVRRDRTLASGLDVLLHAAEHIDLADPTALVDHVTDSLGSAPDDDLCVIVATRTV
ncbi:SpoIIE family protein phosphatase [Actinocatenispora rupis]|uniref:Transcription antitermination regulator n=1 Tax=Actinocatenispora rupis TaxID=519421 RepID=A0A8J3J2V3_9ACTN|nr:SpoIIE family protein phosphatase [Actinocatenispora rupis]GID13575.1 transcription antitermination regulator [Actinocatenispora rupis]